MTNWKFGSAKLTPFYASIAVSSLGEENTFAMLSDTKPNYSFAAVTLGNIHFETGVTNVQNFKISVPNYQDCATISAGFLAEYDDSAYLIFRCRTITSSRDYDYFFAKLVQLDAAWSVSKYIVISQDDIPLSLYSPYVAYTRSKIVLVFGYEKMQILGMNGDLTTEFMIVNETLSMASVGIASVEGTDTFAVSAIVAESGDSPSYVATFDASTGAVLTEVFYAGFSGMFIDNLAISSAGISMCATGWGDGQASYLLNPEDLSPVSAVFGGSADALDTKCLASGPVTAVVNILPRGRFAVGVTDTRGTISTSFQGGELKDGESFAVSNAELVNGGKTLLLTGTDITTLSPTLVTIDMASTENELPSSTEKWTKIENIKSLNMKSKWTKGSNVKGLVGDQQLLHPLSASTKTTNLSASENSSLSDFQSEFLPLD
eukprot:CAMPEP_0115005020 /NCGR_PEP_ID=MMETSP0216-20121206/19602_1 /TAXON_ID=223996 /ORGANISM="Protocruzia adherens, Strain Boccale" /LENGTH=431 /DNA_ID=CAMNT_0002371225 /DNA_START=107 /DNA_END=1402 /DNA_ORIENTATION=-